MMNKLMFGKHKQYHGYHLVDPSPWPLLASLGAFLVTTGTSLYMHFYEKGSFVMLFGFILLILVSTGWWMDVVYESTYEGMHTSLVQKGLRLGMLLFIVSEIMFFFAFFWGFFHSSLAPTIEIGSIWPPKGISVFRASDVPLLNTLILLASGATITAAHHFMISGDVDKVEEGFLQTIGLAALFTALQAMEYLEAPFTISDSVYGSTFFMATGFHGFHVIIGTIFITVCFLRVLLSHFTKQHHLGFEAASWYWHFVDVVWLFLFVTIYWWGGMQYTVSLV
jgi:cytochrome c oxidase subunit 3